MKTIKLDKAIDYYFAKPIICDIIIGLLIVIIETFIRKPWLSHHLPNISILNKSDSLSYLSSLIGTSVSLAGFIIAALTIMITVKSSLKARGYEDSENALEYLFSTKHYQSIIKVFKDSIIELILFFVFLYLIWLLSMNFSQIRFSQILFISSLGITMSAFRSVYILFKILHMEKFKKD